MKRWHLESIVRAVDNRRSKRLTIPDWRHEGLFSGKIKIDFRHETGFAELARRLADLFRRRL